MSDTVGLSGLGLELGRLFRPHGNGRTSEVSLALEDVRVRRRMAEARGSSYEAAGRLWVKEIDRQLAAARRQSEASRQRNARLNEAAAAAVARYDALRKDAGGRVGMMEAEAAKKRYLDQIQALYPQWCRDVEAAAAEKSRQLGGSVLDMQKRRLLAAERFASQMSTRREIEAKERQLLQSVLEGFREQQRQAEQLREASSRGTKDREVGAVIGRQGTDPRASFPACSDTVEAGSPASSLQDSINQLVDLLKRQQSPGEGSWRREGTPETDPDMPPDSPPRKMEPPLAPISGGWGWGAGPSLGSSAQMVPMAVSIPPGSPMQTILVPVMPSPFSAAVSSPAPVEVNPRISAHLRSPIGDVATPSSTSTLNSWQDKPNRAEALAPAQTTSPTTDKARKRLQQIAGKPQHPRYQQLTASEDLTPSSSMDLGAMVVPVTASVQAGSLSPDRISAVETGDGDLEEPEEEAGDFTLAQAAEELALQSIESFPPGMQASRSSDAAAPQPSLRRTVSKGSAPLVSLRPEASAVAKRGTATGPPSPTSQYLSGPKHTHRRSGSFDTDGQQVLGLGSKAGRRDRGPAVDAGISDGQLSAEPSANPSLFMGLSPLSAEGSDKAMRSSSESRSSRLGGQAVSRRLAASASANLGDSIMSDLTEDSAVSFEDEDLAAQREAWNQELERRQELVAQEKAAEEAMRKTAVELEEDELSDAPLGSSGPPVKPGLFRGATTVSASRPAQLQIGGGASGHLPRRASSTGASDYSLHPLSPGSQSGEIGGLQRKHSISSSRSSPKPRLGSFGFGAPLGPASPSAGRGGKRVEMLSSIVSKAFDDDLDFGGSSGDESSGVELGRVVSAVMPTSSAARGGNAEFRGPRLSQSLDTTDEFDF